MKRSFTVCCLLVFGFSITPAFAGHHGACGGNWGGGRSYCQQPRSYGGGFWSNGGNFLWSVRGNVRPSYVSSCRGGYGYASYGFQPSYWSGNYGGNYSYGQSVVVIKPPKPRPNLPITSWNENKLEELALNKFTFARGLDIKTNQIRLQIVARDYHGDTGALKKVKFQVRWIVFKHLKDHDEEVQKHDSIKLKFDEYGRFTEFDD